MVMIALCSSLVGAVMGIRFKVHALFPASVLGVAMVAAVAASNSWAMLSTIAAAGVCVISLQLGYLAGLFTRFCMTASRVAHHRSLRSTAAGS